MQAICICDSFIHVCILLYRLYREGGGHWETLGDGWCGGAGRGVFPEVGLGCNKEDKACDWIISSEVGYPSGRSTHSENVRVLQIFSLGSECHCKDCLRERRLCCMCLSVVAFYCYSE